MSVLLEAISVIARRGTIEEKYPGGMAAYETHCPNKTFCADQHLVRIGFMTPADVEGFARVLASFGLVHLRQGEAIDFVIVDQFRGPTSPCVWIDGGRHPDGYSAAWLRGTVPGWFATPKGWTPLQSKQMHFVDSTDTGDRIVGLSSKENLDVVLDLKTGQERFIGRVPPPPGEAGK